MAALFSDQSYERDQYPSKTSAICAYTFQPTAGPNAIMEFTVIIPVFNSGQKIQNTIASVLSQHSVRDGHDTIRCIVIDGASTDDTLEHVRAFADPRIEIVSEPDSGMYDALAKGLDKASGDVTCYLPAGERFDSHAFSVVSRVFAKFDQISWLTGRAVTRNASGEITDSLLPHPFKRHFIDCGMYGTRLPAIQQESTFWRSALNAEFDLEALRQKKLAGDYFLWRTLARKNEIYVLNAQLGSFTIEPDQLSKSVPGGYRRELRQIRRKPTIFERLHALIHRQLAKRMLPNRKARRMICYDHRLQEWCL